MQRIKLLEKIKNGRVMFCSHGFRVSLFLVLSLIAACGKSDPTRIGIDPRYEVSAPVQVGESFTLHRDKNGKNLVGIKKTSLEKEFLLQVEMMKQNTAPLGSALKSRVVA